MVPLPRTLPSSGLGVGSAAALRGSPRPPTGGTTASPAIENEGGDDTSPFKWAPFLKFGRKMYRKMQP